MTRNTGPRVFRHMNRALQDWFHRLMISTSSEVLSSSSTGATTAVFAFGLADLVLAGLRAGDWGVLGVEGTERGRSTATGVRGRSMRTIDFLLLGKSVKGE